MCGMFASANQPLPASERIPEQGPRRQEGNCPTGRYTPAEWARCCAGCAADGRCRHFPAFHAGRAAPANPGYSRRAVLPHRVKRRRSPVRRGSVPNPPRTAHRASGRPRGRRRLRSSLPARSIVRYMLVSPRPAGRAIQMPSRIPNMGTPILNATQWSKGRVGRVKGHRGKSLSVLNFLSGRSSGRSGTIRMKPLSCHASKTSW